MKHGLEIFGPVPGLPIRVGVRKPASPWKTNVGPIVWDGFDGSGWNGYTMVLRIEAAQLSNQGGSQTRVTFVGPTAGANGGTKIAKAYIGMAAAAGDAVDFETTPVQLLFSGLASTTVAKDTTLVSDVATFSVGAGKAFLAAILFDDAADDDLGKKSSTTGWHAYFKAGDDVVTVDKTGYTQWGTNEAFGISRVESLL